VAGATPTAGLGVVEPPPWPRGWSGHPQKPKKKKKKGFGRGRQIVLAVRGLNLAKESDYKLLMNNHLDMRMFDDEYVHHGLLNLAI
jgi:hypothetical protein